MGKYDKLLLIVTVLLVGFGALMIYSTTSIISPKLAQKGLTEFYYFKRHIFTIIIAFSFMFIAYHMRPSFVRKMAIPLLILSFVLLILVFLPHIGVSAGGAKRWIRIWPSTFQPSEFVKLAMVIFLARYMSMPGYRTDSFASFIKPVIILIPFQIAILKQPDFGAAISLAFLTFAMLFISGVRIKYLAILFIATAPVVYYLLSEPYRLRRITAFIDPWKDPQGDGFQLVQSFIALGSGGITGVGLGSSQQKLSYLPESHTDFIFSIIGEEFGLLGLVFIITLFLLLFIKGISIAHKAKDEFVYYLATGLSLMIALQALINFSVATGLLPTKGLPLPFISYGGSALLVNMVAVGILLNISKGDWISAPSTARELMKRRRAKRIIYDKRM